MRDDFPTRTKERLACRVGFRCSKPQVPEGDQWP
ncbi:MAG: hypothetical protein RLY70_125 [Planctomycetota bacterium]